MHKRKRNPRARWLQLVSGLILIALTVAIATLNRLAPAHPYAHEGLVIYPYLQYGIVVGLIGFIIVCALVLPLTMRSANYLTVVGVVMGASLFISSLHLYLAPTFTHGDHLVYAGTRYHVGVSATPDPVEAYYHLTYALYSCDAWGVFCQATHVSATTRLAWHLPVPHYDLSADDDGLHLTITSDGIVRHDRIPLD
jgi:hypothetical protein